jgi:endonuclease/exonuclease/phosphatase family metal-dependent hydrolase
MSLRVMTWNVWWRFGPWEQRTAAILATIAGQRPDVVCLQEVWGDGNTNMAELIAAELGGFHHVLTDSFVVRPNGEGFHNAVVSRWPLIEVDCRPLPNAAGQDGHRRALWALVDTPWGGWPVVSTHFAYRFDESALRIAQAEVLLAMVAERRLTQGDGDPEVELPTVLCGDLNAVPDSDEIRTLTGRRPGVPNLVFSDCWEHVGEGPGHTWRSDNPYQVTTSWPNRRLDYVMVSWPRPKRTGSPRTAWLAGTEPVDGVVPSDHAAVVVDLATPERA